MAKKTKLLTNVYMGWLSLITQRDIKYRPSDGKRDLKHMFGIQRRYRRLARMEKRAVISRAR